MPVHSFVQFLSCVLSRYIIDGREFLMAVITVETTDNSRCRLISDLLQKIARLRVIGKAIAARAQLQHTDPATVDLQRDC